MSNSGGIFVTGASTGIGEACALGLDKRGYQVFAGVRDKEDGESLQQRASERFSYILVDVVNLEQIKEAAQTISQTLGDKPMAGLINNAGISVSGPLEFVPIEGLRRQLEVNVVSQVSVSQAFIPLLRKGKGRIINVGSISGIFAVPMLGPYCASKFAMEAISDVLRRELKQWDIKVILLEPGAIATKIWGKGRNEAERAIKEAPKEMLQLYESFIDRALKLAVDSEKIAKPPEVVVNAVVHALESRRPKTRYIIGSRAWPQKIITMLPDRIQDRIIASFFGV